MSSHYLCITDDFNSNEFTVIGNGEVFNDTVPVDHADCLIFFANLSFKDKCNLRSCFEVPAQCTTVREYADHAHSELSSLCGNSIAEILLVELENQIIRSNERDSSSNIPELTIKAAKICLWESLEDAWKYAQSFCGVLAAIESTEFTMDEKTALLSDAIHGCPAMLRYYPLVSISKKDGTIGCCDSYAASTIWDIFQLFFILAIKDKTVISSCKHCTEYFTPNNRRDEIYCEKCRGVSYDKKIQEDLIRSTYRRIYKRQHKRKNDRLKISGEARCSQIKQAFQKWTIFANGKLNECLDGTITIEQMEESISSASWLNQK